VEDDTYALDLTLKAIKDTTVSMELRGPYEQLDTQHKEKGLLEHWIDYRKLIINGQEQLKEHIAAWHNQPYRHSLNVKAGAEYFIQIRWQKMPFLKYLRQNFDWCYFVILATFYFFVSYRLLRYFAGLKLDKNRSVADILFLSVFFLLLVLPASHISDAEKSAQENRMLATKPLLFLNRQFNPKFGSQFEQYFNDRFFGRNILINLFKNIKMLNGIYQNNNAIFSKAENIFIYKPQLDGTYMNPEMTKLNKLRDNIYRFAEFCQKDNITLYLVIAPQKVSVYKEKIPLYNLKDKQPFAFYGIKYLEEEKPQNLEIVYPYEILRSVDEEKKDWLYYLSDTHMTDFGEYVVYRELMKKVKEKFPDAKETVLSELKYETNNKVRVMPVNGGYTFGDMNIRTFNNEKYLRRLYKHYDLASHLQKVKIINQRFEERIIYHEHSKYKVMLLGSSYVHQMSALLDFNEIYKLQFNHYLLTTQHKITDFYSSIQNFKPDMIIILLNEGDFYRYVAAFY